MPVDLKGLEIVELPIGQLDPNPWNPNKQSEIVARAERESIQTFGFIDPVTVRPHPTSEGRFQIIDGEHRWREAQDLGYETIPCVILDIGDAAAMKLTVVLNETRGEADVVLLGALLSDLQRHLDEESFAMALPYSSSELEHLLSLGREDWDQYAARAAEAAAAAPPPVDGHQVLIEMDDDQYEAFVEHTRIIRAALGIDSVPDAVLVGLEEAAAVLAERAAVST